MLRDIEEHWLALDEQVRILRESRAGLVEACAVTEHALNKAKAALSNQNVRELLAGQERAVSPKGPRR